MIGGLNQAGKFVVGPNSPPAEKGLQTKARKGMEKVMNKFQKFVIWLFVVLAALSVGLVPSPALAQGEQPPYLPAIGKVVSAAQSADVEQTCSPGQAEVRPFNPQSLNTQAIEAMPNHLFVPAVINGLEIVGDMCTDVSPYLGGNVFLGQGDSMIPIVENGQAGFSLGDLTTVAITVPVSPTMSVQRWWDLTRAQMPANTKSLKLIGVWNFTPEATTAGLERIADSPIDLKIWLDSNRAVIMDERLRQGLDDEYILDPRKDLVYNQPIRGTGVVLGTVCPALMGFSAIRVHPLGFLPVPHSLEYWGFIDYPEGIITLCGDNVTHYPFITSDQAFKALPEAEKAEINQEVERRTREWNRFTLLNPNPAFDPTQPQPVYAETNNDALVWGSVVFVIVVVAAAAITAQPEVLLLVFAP